MAGVITAVLGLKKTGFKAGLNEAKGDAQKFKTEAGSIFGGLGKTIAGALTVGAVVGFARSLIDLGGEVRASADTMGMEVEALQEMKHAFAMSNVSAETFAIAVGKMNQKVGDSLAGNPAAIQSFEDLGVSLQDIADNAGDPAALLEKIADGFSKAGDKTKAYNALIEVFGKQGRRLSAALGQGSEEIKKLRGEAAKLTEGEVNKLDMLGDKWDSLVDRVKISAGRVALGVFGMFDPENWKDGKWMKGNFQIPGETTTPDPGLPPGFHLAETGASNSRHNGRGEKWTKPNYVEDPREKKRRDQESKDHEVEMKYLDEKAKAENEAAAIRKASIDSYLTKQQQIASLTAEILKVTKQMQGNDPKRAAELNAQREALMAQTLDEMTAENLKTPDQRREEKRAAGDRQRAMNKARREMIRRGINPDMIKPDNGNAPEKQIVAKLGAVEAAIKEVRDKLEAAR